MINKEKLDSIIERNEIEGGELVKLRELQHGTRPVLLPHRCGEAIVRDQEESCRFTCSSMANMESEIVASACL